MKYLKDRTRPDLLIEQIFLDEVDQIVWEDSHSFSLTEDQERYLQADNEKILNENPPDIFVKQLQNKTQGSKVVHFITHNSLNSAIAVAAVSIAVIGMLALYPMFDRSPSFAGTDTIRLKGEDHRLQIFRQAQDGNAVQLEPGSTVSEDDELQLAYRSMSMQYGLLASVDGLGMVSLHYPPTVFDEPLLEVGAQQFLPYAFRLDDAPSHEQFVFLLAEKSFGVQQALQWIVENLDNSNMIPENTLPDFAEGSVLFSLKKD